MKYFCGLFFTQSTKPHKLVFTFTLQQCESVCELLKKQKENIYSKDESDRWQKDLEWLKKV